MTVTNASGEMYIQNRLLNSDGQGNAFQNSGHKNYNNFAGGTHPPTRNFGVGTGVTTFDNKYSKRYTHNSDFKSFYKI